MDINNRLFVEIHPFEGSNAPHPDPIRDAHFDPRYVYKVLGMYNPSETSECYFVLSNPRRQIWFIPQRHLLAYKLIDSDEFFLPIEPLNMFPECRGRAAHGSDFAVESVGATARLQSSV